MNLNENQKAKLDALSPDELKKETLTTLIRVFKIVDGEQQNFEFEYDFDLDEVNVLNIPLDDFIEYAPTIYNKIIKWNGGQIFKATQGNKFAKTITNTKLHEEKIKEIESNTRLSESKRNEQIKIREQMRKEYLKVHERGGHLNSQTCWTIWKIKEGQKTREDLTKDLGEEKLEKEIAKVEYLGKDFIDRCKEIAYPEEEGELVEE